MRKFEVGKIYMDTERSLTQSEKAERKKITKSYLEYEVIDFDCCPSAPQIAA